MVSLKLLLAMAIVSVAACAVFLTVGANQASAQQRRPYYVQYQYNSPYLQYQYYRYRGAYPTYGYSPPIVYPTRYYTTGFYSPLYSYQQYYYRTRR